MGAEREPQGSRSEFNRLTSPTSFIGERFLYIKQGIHNIREFTSQRWQDISRFNKADMGRAIAITSTFIASLTGTPFAKAETLRDGGVTGELTKVSDRYKLGFRALAEQIPTIVGEPLEDERYGSNGDSLQQTTKGLMVWRKGDNWTAFTDGVDTYINGPFGLAVRPNDQRFKWEENDRPAEVAGVQATPTVPQPTATPIPTAILMQETKTDLPQQAILRNMFTDTYPLPTGLIRRQFTSDQVINNGIEFKGKEFIAADYAKNMVFILQKVPEYDALVRRYIKSIEVSDSSLSSAPQVLINDTLGNGGNFMLQGFNMPDIFSVQISTADLIYKTKFTELAANGSNNAGRFTMGPIKDPQLEKTWNIKQEQAIIEACNAAIDFATKAKLIPGIIDKYQARKALAESQLKALQ